MNWYHSTAWTSVWNSLDRVNRMVCPIFSRNCQSTDYWSDNKSISKYRFLSFISWNKQMKFYIPFRSTFYLFITVITRTNTIQAFMSRKQSYKESIEKTRDGPLRTKQRATILTVDLSLLMYRTTRSIVFRLGKTKEDTYFFINFKSNPRRRISVFRFVDLFSPRFLFPVSGKYNKSMLLPSSSAKCITLGSEPLLLLFPHSVCATCLSCS